MAISINWATKVISVPQADLTHISGVSYELDVDWLRLALKDIEDSGEGMAFLDTHRHSTQSTLSGVTYARQFEIINGYTIAFENTGTPYKITCIGANHNVSDVTNFDGGCSLIIGNSAGLIVVDTGGGGGGGSPTAAEIAEEVWTRAIEDGHSAEEILRALLSLGLAAATGGGTSAITFRDLANTKNRLKIKVKNADGDRNAPEILDLT